MISVKDTCPGDIKNTLTRHAITFLWQHGETKPEVEELKGRSVVRANQSHAERKVNQRWTARQAKQ